MEITGRLASCFLLSALLAPGQPSGAVRGRVVDARGGEPLGRVQVQLAGAPFRTVTSPQGEFEFPAVSPGEYTLHVGAVGYYLVKKTFQIGAGEVKEFEVVLTTTSQRQTDSVEVSAGPFELERQDTPTTLTLSGEEAKNLGSVLADDPLRAVQNLPGVTSNNDFASEFSVRGASYHRLGVYLDDVVLHMPFHMVQGEPGASMTIFNGDMLDAIALHPGAYSPRYEDRTAGALDLTMRDGSRQRLMLRATASASNAGVMAEGPLGRAAKGAWMASARKSYLQYIIRRTSSEPALAFGFTDVQGRVTYDLSPRHQAGLSVVHGSSGLDRTDARSRLGVNSIMTSDYDFTLVNLSSRYAPHPRLLVTNRGAFLRERGGNWSRDELSLGAEAYGEWIWNLDATWMWSEQNGLDWGYNLRRLREDGYDYRYQFNPFAIRRLDEFRGAGLRQGGYLQQSWGLAARRVLLSAGGRWDRHSVSGRAALSPVASVAIQVRSGTRFHLGWGQYVQYPDLAQFFSLFGHRNLAPERATHFEAALEQRLGQRARLRLEAYNRQDRDLLFRPWFEPRLLNNRMYNPPANAPIRNSQRGYSRGFQALLQRRAANGFTGWASYAYGAARLHDGDLNLWFPADQDQKHTVNVFASRRITPTVNLSVRWNYGSGFPVPGFLRKTGASYFLAADRNQERIGSYRRLDLRINKALVFDRWKMTVFGEVVNLFNRRNIRFDTFNGYNSRTGLATLTFDKMFPILPSAGLLLEF